MPSSETPTGVSFFGEKMAFRIVLIENEVSIKLKLNNLIISKALEEEIWIPLSDISIIVLDNLATTITARMLSALAEEGISLVICGMKHLPCGYYGPLVKHTRAAKMIDSQINRQNGNFYELLWKDIVAAKINNQKQVLEILKMSPEIIKKLDDLAEQIEPGDPTNREAHAAKIYFNTLMGTTFSRGNEDILLNSGLDYGYAILRAYIARVSAAYGLNTLIGIHHKNEYNQFNLCDDLIEPFRPFVDLYAYSILNDKEIFTAEDRHKLINLLNHHVFYRDKNMFLCNVIDNYIEQVAGVISNTRESIVYPEINLYKGIEEDEI